MAWSACICKLIDAAHCTKGGPQVQAHATSHLTCQHPVDGCICRHQCRNGQDNAGNLDLAYLIAQPFLLRYPMPGPLNCGLNLQIAPTCPCR